jgi:hypothetical protein
MIPHPLSIIFPLNLLWDVLPHGIDINIMLGMFIYDVNLHPYCSSLNLPISPIIINNVAMNTNNLMFIHNPINVTYPPMIIIN